MLIKLTRGIFGRPAEDKPEALLRLEPVLINDRLIERVSPVGAGHERCELCRLAAPVVFKAVVHTRDYPYSHHVTESLDEVMDQVQTTGRVRRNDGRSWCND